MADQEESRPQAKKAAVTAEDLLKVAVQPPEAARSNENAAPVSGEESLRQLRQPMHAGTALAIIAIGLFVLGALVMFFQFSAGLVLWVLSLGVAIFALLTFLLHKKGRV